jgi:hypothetical protein
MSLSSSAASIFGGRLDSNKCSELVPLTISLPLVVEYYWCGFLGMVGLWLEVKL